MLRKSIKTIGIPNPYEVVCLALGRRIRIFHCRVKNRTSQNHGITEAYRTWDDTYDVVTLKSLRGIGIPNIKSVTSIKRFGTVIQFSDVMDRSLTHAVFGSPVYWDDRYES